MSDAITPDQFRKSPGTLDWRIHQDGAYAHFTTKSFTQGVHFISDIAQMADEVNHHPDVLVQYTGVTVRLISHDIGGISRRDANLACMITEAARAAAVVPDAEKIVPFHG